MDIVGILLVRCVDNGSSSGPGGDRSGGCSGCSSMIVAEWAPVEVIVVGVMMCQ